MEARPPSPTILWEEVVSVREERDLETTLLARLSGGTGVRSVGVTDLVALRRAYYRYFAPDVEVSPARRVRLDQGRLVHRALGSRLAGEGTLEARVRREGLVGRVDILADLPIEVKTSTSFIPPGEIASLRPEHLEQLGMYCALVGRPVGRLLTLLSNEGGVTDVQALDVTFRDPGRILEEMKARAGRLRSAWAEGRPDALPRCPWYGRGCEFAEAGRCSCTGNEPVDPSEVLRDVGAIAPREDVESRLRPLVAGTGSVAESAVLPRFRDVLYPRRAYFERTRPPVERAPETPVEPKLPVPAPDLYARLTEALESGVAGEVARLASRSDEPEEEVVGFRGTPVLVRTSRAWARYRPEQLVARAPQYALELGLRCAVAGADRALLVLGFERAETDRDRLQLLELRFGSRTPFSRLLRERSRQLAAALRSRTHLGLPPCPSWAVAGCPFRAECGCGGAG